jgi:oligopeptide transport system substrate-binding protein
MRHLDLLENFFYSLSPIEMQATLPLIHLETLFRLFLEANRAELPKKESCFFEIQETGQQTFAIIRARDQSFKQCVLASLQQQDIPLKSFTTAMASFQDFFYLGYIFDSQDLKKHGFFIKALQNGLKEWQEKLEKTQMLRLSFQDLPISLDPRLGGDEVSGFIVKMLFDGLMRIDEEGKPVCAIASSYIISPDYKRYIFKLRDCYWSNGAKITALDFEYSWKKILSPDFSTPFAYIFYPIKNARLAKEGEVPISAVGIKALDSTTLSVDFEFPTPYFLELTADTLYSPVNHVVDKMHPNWALQEAEFYVCNGPFQIKKVKELQGYELIKNPYYWDARSVCLDQILISKNNAYTALKMYKNAEIDWLGRPMRPWDSLFTQQCEEKVDILNLARVYWYCFNTKRFPFHHPKLRRALAYAINRQEILAAAAYGGIPATTPLPINLFQHQNEELIYGDINKARLFFEEALEELKIKKEQFPIINLIHMHGELRDNTAKVIKRQLYEGLGVHCRIEAYEWRVLFEKITSGDYEMGSMSWKSWINDPIYTLNAFKFSSDKVNFPKWDHPEYQSLLDAADQEIDPKVRLTYLTAAEAILLEEMPVIPIFHEVHECVKKKHLQVAIDSKTGNVDFKKASIIKRL